MTVGSFRMDPLYNFLFRLGLCSLLLTIPGTRSSPSHFDPKGSELILSILMYRHGDRTPASFYPNDPYSDPKYWPEAPGQLVEEGMRRHFELGRWFRKRYQHFLPETYFSSDIYVHSTDMDRTIMSAQCNLAGLYLPKDKQIFDNWNSFILWRPIPIHEKPSSDPMFVQLAATQDCPRYNTLYRSSAALANLAASIAESYISEVITNNSGAQLQSPLDVISIYDTLDIEDHFHYELPPWTKSIYPEPLRSMMDKFFGIGADTPQLARLQFGPVLQQMRDAMQEKISGTLVPDYKMIMYSAHDATIGFFLQSLGLYNGIRPPYCSTIILELRRKGDQHFVTLDYKNTTSSVFPLTIPGCDGYYCSFDQFVDVLKPLIPTNWTQECNDLSDL